MQAAQEEKKKSNPTKKREPTKSAKGKELQVSKQYEKPLQDRQLIVENLKKQGYDKQGSKEWLFSRSTRITASDMASALDMNKYEPRYKFITKKVYGSTFEGNVHTNHGKKYEKIAIQIYEQLYKTRIAEFGLIKHENYNFLAASPDGIVDIYDEFKNMLQDVGRMVEIKCPVVRQIKKTGKIIDNRIPIYYWIQIQLQLEVCNLDECDFWQCQIKEYDRNSFNNDFRTFKGSIISIMPKSLIGQTYTQDSSLFFNNVIYIYPSSIPKNSQENDAWISQAVSDIKENYALDKVIYWFLDTSDNLLIKRDKEWFTSNLPKMVETWQYVEFFKNNGFLKNKLGEFIQDCTDNTQVMKLISKLYHYYTNLSELTTLLAEVPGGIFTDIIQKLGMKNPLLLNGEENKAIFEFIIEYSA